MIKKIFMLGFFLNSLFNCFSQEEWIRTYHNNEDVKAKSIVEAYDNGYLLAGWLERSFPHLNWIMKTDINGYKLWEKTIGSSDYVSTIHDIAQNNEGSIFITGTTYKESSWGGDPYVMKLNACGEKMWCSILYTYNNGDDGYRIIPTDDGGCFAALVYRGFENDPNSNGENRICLARFNDQGTKLWETCFNGPVSTSNEMLEDMTITPEGNLLFSGKIYSHDTATGTGYLKCYYIMSNSDGNFLWETIVEKEAFDDNYSGGKAIESHVSPSENYIFSNINHALYVNGETEYRPAFIILDLDGNVQHIKDLTTGCQQNGVFKSSQMLNDSIAIGSAGCWGNDAWEENPALAVKVDTSGNIITQKELEDVAWLSKVEKTHDDKFLFFHIKDSDDGNYDAYLHKYNQILEYDSIYNQPMEYDTLCSYPIASDTISLDGCMLSTSSEENAPEPKTYSPELKVYPNPARGPVTVELPGYIEKHNSQKGFQITRKDYQYQKDAVLHIINIHGQKVASREAKGQEKMTLPTQDLSPGVYMVIMEVNGKRYAKEKLIVRE